MSLPQFMRGAVLLGVERIEVQEVPVPRPRSGEIVLEVRAATTCGTDVKVFRRGGHPRMLRVPTLFGHEVAGTVAAVGDGVENVAVSEAIVVANSAPCLRCDYCERGRENLCRDLAYLNGAFAEFLLVPERFVRTSVHRIPEDVSFERAALTEPLACVLHGLSACELDERSRRGPIEVVVFGAGPIGLLFVGALHQRGQRVVLADPNPSRLEAGRAFGAAETIEIARGGGQADLVRERTRGGEGAEVVIEATGVPEVWADAIDTARTGGLVNLFGGCAPGTEVPLDTHRVHYSEITVKGVYHHRPQTVREALSLLSQESFPAERLLTDRRRIDDVEAALRSMMRKEAIKVVITP